MLKDTAFGAAALSALSLRPASGAAAAITIDPVSGTEEANDPWLNIKLGVASYTFRKLPLEVAIKGIERVNLKYVSVKDAHIPLASTTAERKILAQKFRDAGITPLSCGNLDMKNDEADIRRFFEYAKDIDVPTIVCTPHPDSMPILDRMVKEYDIKLAIHNHGPGKEYSSPYDVWKIVEKYDSRIGLCIDVGHTLRAKVDPATSILKCRARLYDLHLKDLYSDELNARLAEGGRGVVDFESIYRALVKINYQHLAGFEYEKDAEDPLPGLAESVGYSRGVMKHVKS